MIIKIDFVITKDEALSRIKQFVPNLKQQFEGTVTDVYENWNGYNADFGFKAYGAASKGTLKVFDNYIEIDSKLPFIALPFKGVIDSKIKEAASDLLKP